MLIKNLDESLVNGSTGRVVRFVDPAVYGTDGDAEGLVDCPPSESCPQPLPVVEFALHNGSKRQKMIDRESFTSELPSGEVEASRAQVRSRDQRVSIYKRTCSSHWSSRGQSASTRRRGSLYRVSRLTSAKSLKKVHALDRTNRADGEVQGQAYVALSRARSLDTLQVLRFDPAKVKPGTLIDDVFLSATAGHCTPQSADMEQGVLRSSRSGGPCGGMM